MNNEFLSMIVNMNMIWFSSSNGVDFNGSLDIRM